MEVFIIGLHIVLCLFLILVVLLQPGKGADFGAAMGGASQEAFGAAGSVSILTKITAVVAAMFMATSLGLAWYSNTSGGGGELSPELLEKAASGDAADTTEGATSPEEENSPETAPEDATPEAPEGSETEANSPAESPADTGTPGSEEAAPEGAPSDTEASSESEEGDSSQGAPN
jgi:preprotein translocase subunit SecG